MQVAVVLYEGFTALDFIGPYEVLRYLPDCEVRFLSHDTGPVAADSGALLVAATHSFDETPSPDVIVVPGGMTSFQHAYDEKLLEWLRSAHVTSTWTTSVCSGSIILAAAGLLTDRQATSHWSVIKTLSKFGAMPVGDQRIVQQGKIVTAAGVSAGLDMALWLAGKIGGDAQACAIQLAIEYDPQPPYDMGHVTKASSDIKARASMLLGREFVRAGQIPAPMILLWKQMLAKVRGRKRRAASDAN